MGVSPKPSKFSSAKAFGLAQQTAFGFEHVPLNAMDWPGTTLARRVILTPLEPMACETVAVRGPPVWKGMIALNDHPFTAAPSTPAMRPPQVHFQVHATPPSCVA